MKNIDVSILNLTHDYNLIKTTNYKESIEKSDEKINIIDIDIDNEVLVNKHFSKSSNNLIDKETKDKMELGTYMHYLLEVFDFKNPDYSFVEDKYKKYLEMFINSGIDFNGKIYKEYEFIYEENNTTSHGIIDLMIEYDNNIKIIDYKLKNVDDDGYLKQLSGYKDYISKKSGKDVSIYLYSIINGELKKLDQKTQVFFFIEKNKEKNKNIIDTLDGNGKGILNSKVGLITYDEVLHAGGYYNQSNTGYYLYNGNYGIWTMSPSGGTELNAVDWTVFSGGNVSASGVIKVYSFRPVINLKSDVLVTGTGTLSDPYVVKTN